MRWSQEEIEILRTYYPHHGCAWQEWRQLLPYRTSSAIAGKAFNLGIQCYPEIHQFAQAHGQQKYAKAESLRNVRKWTHEEDVDLMKTLLEIKEKTGRSGEAILARMQELMYQHRRKKL